MSQQQILKAEKIIQNFLWKGRRAKIPLSILKCKKKLGGLKLTDLSLRHRSLHLQWVSKIRRDSSLHYGYQSLIPEAKDMIWICNIHPKDVKKLIKKQSFWLDVLYAWCSIHYSEPQNVDEVMEQVIWYNSLIRIDNETLSPFFNLVQKGLLRIRDIAPNGQFLNFKELCQKFHIPEKRFDTWMWYTGLQRAIPCMWKFSLKDKQSNQFTNQFEEIILQQKISSKLYNIMISEIGEHTYIKYWYNWSDMVGKEYDYESYTKLFVNMYKTTQNTKLWDFQYRLLLKKIFTNDVLNKWGIVPSNQCEICRKAKQDIPHLMIYCENSVNLWNSVKEICQKNRTECNWNPIAIMEGMVHAKTGHVVNYIVLHTKQFIFRNKCLGKQSRIEEPVLEISEVEQVEKFINVRSISQHQKYWSPVLLS